MKKTFTSTIAFSLLAGTSAASADVLQPQEVIDRAMVTPEGQLTVGLDINVGLSEGTGSSIGDYFLYQDTPNLGMRRGISADYGVADKIDASISYAYSIDEFEAKGNLGVDVGYSLVEDDEMSIAARGLIGYDLLREGISPLQLGADFRYKLSDSLALYSANQLILGLYSKESTVGPVTVEIKDPKYIQLPVSVGYQVNEQIFAWAGTNLALIELADSNSGIIFADFLPLTLGGSFAINEKIDVGAQLNFSDLANDGTTSLGLSARLHL